MLTMAIEECIGWALQRVRRTGKKRLSLEFVLIKPPCRAAHSIIVLRNGIYLFTPSCLVTKKD